LIAYECPTCSYVTSILWQPKEPRKNPDAPAVKREDCDAGRDAVVTP
jgi:hypothetical protein